MVYIYIVIDRNDLAFNYYVDENAVDINGRKLTVEQHVEDIFNMERYVEKVKVYLYFNDRMRHKQTFERQ